MNINYIRVGGLLYPRPDSAGRTPSHVMHSDSSTIGKQRLSEWVYTAEPARLKEFDACTKAVHNWSDEILNSFD